MVFLPLGEIFSLYGWFGRILEFIADAPPLRPFKIVPGHLIRGPHSEEIVSFAVPSRPSTLVPLTALFPLHNLVLYLFYIYFLVEDTEWFSYHWEKFSPYIHQPSFPSLPSFHYITAYPLPCYRSWVLFENRSALYFFLIIHLFLPIKYIIF